MLSDKPLLLSLAGAYLSAYGSSGEQSSREWHLLEWSGCEVCKIADACDRRCDLLKAIPFDRIAGFVFESGNMHEPVKLPPVGLVRQIGGCVREQGGLVVANEITTGMGRTGAWCGFEHYDLRPDIVALGKGLGSGYPVSAVALRPGVASSLESMGFRYVQSHQNDPLGCAIALEVISVMRDEDLIERSRRVGTDFLDRLRRLASGPSTVREVRGRGLMIALELERSRISAASAHAELLGRGFLVGLSEEPNLLRFYPPLTIGEDDIGRLLDTLPAVIERAPT